MTPSLLTLRAANLLLVLAIAWLAGLNLLAQTAATLIMLAVEAMLVFSGRLRKSPRNLATPLATDIAFVMWIAAGTGPWSGVLDLGVLVPAVIAAVEFGPLIGALAAGLPVIALAAAAPDFVPAWIARGAVLALVPAAAGLALGPARSRAAAGARGTVGRLRAAQVGEYLSFALFQLREYVISISSLSEAIALAPKDDDKHGWRVERLRHAAAELGLKLSRVLGDQTALATGRVPDSAAVDLVALVKACIHESREAFALDGAQMSVLVASETPAIHSDGRLIELALLAVLQNSLEACAARGGGAVSVLLRREGENAEIEVSDDGGGVSETDKTTMFEPFVSARGASHGLGLGLSMSRRFLERIGGGLRVKSKAGYTAVLLVVPLKQVLPSIRLEESTWAGRRAA